MDARVQAFVDKLTSTQFADLKGSWANMHLELSEKLLNEVLGIVMGNPSLKKNYPMLALLNAAQVKGSLSVDLK